MRKGVAFVERSEVNSERTVGITFTNGSLPLLRLPQEIKNQIYTLVLGGHFIHIRQRLDDSLSEHKLTHELCRADMPEGIAREHFDRTCSGECWSQDSLLLVTNVNALFACRQIYNEPRFIAFSSNTFSFRWSFELEEFITHNANCGNDFNLAIRSLNLHTSAFDSGWGQVIELVTQHMLLLETVNLTSDHIKGGVKPLFEDYEKSICRYASLKDDLAVLGNLNLKRLTVAVDNQCDMSLRLLPVILAAKACHQRHQGLLAQQEWAREVKEAISGRKACDPAGEECKDSKSFSNGRESLREFSGKNLGAGHS